jgi:hypothetical protein
LSWNFRQDGESFAPEGDFLLGGDSGIQGMESPPKNGGFMGKS